MAMAGPRHLPGSDINYKVILSKKKSKYKIKRAKIELFNAHGFVSILSTSTHSTTTILWAAAIAAALLQRPAALPATNVLSESVSNSTLAAISATWLLSRPVPFVPDAARRLPTVRVISKPCFRISGSSS